MELVCLDRLRGPIGDNFPVLYGVLFLFILRQSLVMICFIECGDEFWSNRMWCNVTLYDTLYKWPFIIYCFVRSCWIVKMNWVEFILSERKKTYYWNLRLKFHIKIIYSLLFVVGVVYLCILLINNLVSMHMTCSLLTQ